MAISFVVLNTVKEQYLDLKREATRELQMRVLVLLIIMLSKVVQRVLTKSFSAICSVLQPNWINLIISNSRLVKTLPICKNFSSGYIKRDKSFPA